MHLCQLGTYYSNYKELFQKHCILSIGLFIKQCTFSQNYLEITCNYICIHAWTQLKIFQKFEYYLKNKLYRIIFVYPAYFSKDMFRNMEFRTTEIQNDFHNKKQVYFLFLQSPYILLQYIRISQGFIMISKELLQHITEIRRTDNDLCVNANPLFQVDSIQYFQHLQLLLQEAQRLQFKNTTKYLAKKYFDIFLSKYPQQSSEYSTLIIITCLRTAAKFNQTVQLYELYTIEYCIQQSGGKYQRQDFIQCQIQLLRALSFKMRMTSPYEFIVVKCLLPHLKQAINILNSIIDFSLSLPQLRAASAQGIFFGSLLYSCKEKNQPQIAFGIINALTFKWGQAMQIAGILEDSLKKILQE